MYESDWVDPLPGDVALLDATFVDGRLRLEVNGVLDEPALVQRFARLGDVDIVPRRLRPARCMGHMEREERRLQLRYVLRAGEHLSTIHVAEDGERVIVFGIMCLPEEGDPDAVDEVESPYHVYLDAPLGERAVIDGFTCEDVPYKNVYLDIQRRLDARTRT